MRSDRDRHTGRFDDERDVMTRHWETVDDELKLAALDGHHPEQGAALSRVRSAGS
jgi:hypothetical protein